MQPSDTKGPRGTLGHVVVIGGAGFVGSVLVPKLLDRGYRVTVLDAFLYGSDGIERHARRRRFGSVQGDLRSVESMVRGCRTADAIVHLGGLVGDPSCAVDASLTVDINLKSTAMIAEVARGLGIPRMVFASSCAVYGAATGVVDETAPPAPRSIYARTKAESERILMGAADDTFSTTALRFGTFHGISPRPRFDLVVNLLTARAVREGSIAIFGGNQWRPFIHVGDGADGIIAALEAPRELVAGEAFNVGSDEENYTLRQVAHAIKAIVPGVLVSYEDAAAAEANYRVSFAKIRDRLGFVPNHSLADGIAEVKAAVESETIADYREVRYNNHRALTAGDTAAVLGGLGSKVAAAAASA